MSVDWFAVDCVLNGTTLPLTPDERRMVVRRMEHRLLVMGHHDVPGMLTAAELGERMGCTARTVDRISATLPPADKMVCDVCRCDMWVLRNDVIEPHSDFIFKDCPTSNLVFEADWESELANTTVWLARKLREGDTFGVWEYVERVKVSRMRELLVAALAGVEDCDDPFAWLKEAV